MSFALDDSVSTIQFMLKQFHTVHAITATVRTSPSVTAFISTIGFRQLEHKQGMCALDQDNAFMLLVLTEQYLVRLGTKQD